MRIQFTIWSLEIVFLNLYMVLVKAQVIRQDCDYSDYTSDQIMAYQRDKVISS